MRSETKNSFILLLVSVWILTLPVSSDKEIPQTELDAAIDEKIPKISKIEGIFSQETVFSLASQNNANSQAVETITVSGRVFNANNITQPLANVSILAFFMKDAVQYNPGIFEIPNTLGINISLPDGTVSIQFSFGSVEAHIEKYPYLAYLAFPGSNVSIINLKEWFVSNSGNDLDLGEILVYPFADLGILGVSGISHINATVPEENFLRRPNLPSDEYNLCAPLTYQVTDSQSGQLLLDVPMVFIQAFSTIIPLEDFFLWLPKDKTVEVRFIFYTSTVGWVDETWMFNTTYGDGLPFSFHLLTLDVAKKALLKSKERFKEIESRGINLDHYWPHLRAAQLSQERSLDFWSQANPNITYSGTLQFFDLSEMGFKALFEAEMAILQAQRAAKLANLYFGSLSSQPAGIYALTTLILATVISILVSQAITGSKRRSLLLRIIVFSIMLATAFSANPLLQKYLETEEFLVFGISLPILAVVTAIFLLVAIGSLFAPIHRLQFFDKPQTFLTLSIRNLRRRKSRTIVMFSTLGIAITAFVLIVSNNYEVDVITEGENADYIFDDGILIENYISIPLQGSFQLPLTKRVEIVTNVTLQAYNERDAAIAKRYYSTLFEEEPEITISAFSSGNNWTHQLHNFLAISPDHEEKITNLQSRFRTLGSWLMENSSEVLVSESLQQKLNISVNETIILTYNASGTVLSLPLKVPGIYDDALGDLRNVNGKTIAPPNYNASRPCNSTEFVILDFEYWRVQLARAISATTPISVSEAPPTQIILGTTDINIAKELADRLEQQRIIMGKDNMVYTVRVSFFGKTEGVIPQIIPLAISCLVVYQIILNSVWERRREIRVYGTLGLSDRGVKILLSTEYIILGGICGAIAYFFGLILFPVVKAANIESSFLSQKTDASLAIFSIILAVVICALAAIPAIARAYGEIVPQEKERPEDSSTGSFVLPAHFDPTDRPWLEGKLATIPFFQDASFDELGVANGQNKAKITVETINTTLRAILHPGELSAKQIKQITKKWLLMGLKKHEL
ncbi:MAG: ABC transporter permease [Candidatus Heimdallarchaeota archaeon]